jgi:nucleotide-binding universal stress UspA family protein
MYRRIAIGYDGSDEARDALALAELLKDPDGVVEQVSAPGQDPARIRRLVEDHEADLFVLGSSSRAAAGTVLTGPVGRALLAGCHCPIAVAPRGYRESARAPQLVAIAFETEDEALHGVQEGAPLAQDLGAGVRLLSLVPPLRSWALRAGADAGYSRADVEQHHVDPYAHVLQHALARVPDGVPAEGRLVMCSSRRVLLDELKAGVHLLVMASPGVRPVAGVRPGAAALTAMRAAPCPVLLAPTGVRPTHHTESESTAAAPESTAAAR